MREFIAFRILTIGVCVCLNAQQLSAAPRTQPASPEMVLQLGHSSAVTSVAVSPNGRLLASSGYDGRLRIWDLQNGTIIRGFESGFKKAYLQFSKDNQQLLADDRLISVETGEEIRLNETARENWLVSTAPLSVEVARSEDHVTVIDVKTGAKIRVIQAKPEANNIEGVGFSPDFKLLACAGQGACWVVDLATGQTIQRFPTAATNEYVLAAAFTPDGAQVIVAGYHLGVMRIFDLKSGAMLRQFRDSTLPVREAALSANASELATEAFGHVTVWDLPMGKPRAELYHVFLPDQVYSSLAISPGGRFLALGAFDGNAGFEGGIQVFDLQFATDAPRQVMQWGGDFTSGPVKSVQFSCDGKWLKSDHRGEDNIHYWDVFKEKQLPAMPTGNWLDPLAGSTLVAEIVDGGAVAIKKASTGKIHATLRWVTTREGDNNSISCDKEISLMWLCTTPDGHWSGPPGVDRYITYRVNGEIRPASDFPALHDEAAVTNALRDVADAHPAVDESGIPRYVPPPPPPIPLRTFLGVARRMGYSEMIESVGARRLAIMVATAIIVLTTIVGLSRRARLLALRKRISSQ